jgi:fructose 1,6-bisphosphatase
MKLENEIEKILEDSEDLVFSTDAQDVPVMNMPKATEQILTLISKVCDDVIKPIEERRDMEKFRAENHKTEKEYKRGKYVGLRYAVDLARQRKKKFIQTKEGFIQSKGVV